MLQLRLEEIGVTFMSHFLISLIQNSPTPWHACRAAAVAFDLCGFQMLSETVPWKLRTGKKYVVTRNGSSLIAFAMPKKTPTSAHIAAAHLDSPALKLKPNGVEEKEGLALFHLEVYGAPILASWVGRDLFFAGRLFYREKNGHVANTLIALPELVVQIPHLAIHLDRQVNDTGLILQKEEHLIALGPSLGEKGFQKLLEKKLPKEAELLYSELYAVPNESPDRIGMSSRWASSYRLDNMSCSGAILEAFIEQEASDDILKMAVFWNHEEIGSQTQEGAGSSFFSDILQRITASTKQDYYCLKAASRTLSCDVAHAFNPNHQAKYDTLHRLHMGKGIAIKVNADQRYVTDPALVSQLLLICQKAKIPYQFFSSRNDIRSGSTVGPIHAALLGIPTVDIGIPLLGMHAAREVIDLGDYSQLIHLLKHFFVK